MTSTTNDEQIRVLAGKEEERLVNAFFVLYKTARIIEDNNPTFKNQAEALFRLMQQTFELDGMVIIKAIGNRYFVNNRLVKFDDKGISGASTVVAEWKTLGVGGVHFNADTRLEDMQQFIRFISQIRPNSQDINSLTMSLQSHRLSTIQLLSAVAKNEEDRFIPEEVRRQFRKAARSTFFKAMNVVEEVVVRTREDADINISKTKRVVHSLIDHITRDESSIIELTAIKDFDDYTYAHSTNVCIYALTLGVRLGLDRARLSQLGFSALFHDIGKVKLPTDLIRKPDAYDENDWLQMQSHPLLGAKTVLRNLKFDMHSARAARGAFEHHINSDFTGYPRLHHEKRPTNLFSQIISIVDSFDALTSGRVYLKEAISPDKVLKKMQHQMKSKFDSFLLRIFTDVVGIYPSGSLVLLTTDEVALVLTNNDVDKSRPYVKIIGNAEGLLPTAEWVDLAAEFQAHRKIVRLIEPERYGLRVEDFILDD
ncbi:MAG: HD domain-containing protein [bacterium]|nr:HD domain-containing protein [bacterium]